MTSIATVVAAIPPALALGAWSRKQKPMAIAVISGVIVSTLLTLFVVPSVYSILNKIRGEKKVQSDEKGI